MNVLVIGGARFIGYHLVEALVAHGDLVTIFHRGGGQSCCPRGAREILGDRNHLSQFTSQFDPVRPDVVIDMICSSAVEARLAAKIFNRFDARLIVISSMDVYLARDILWQVELGPIQSLPLSEDAQLRKVHYPYRFQAKQADEWAFSYEKILVEKIYQRESQLDLTILRLPAVYGPRDYQNRILGYLRRMVHQREYILLEHGEDTWKMSRTYVRNVAAAIAAVAHGNGGPLKVYNIEPDCDLSQRKWIEMIAHSAKWNGEILSVPRASLPESMRKRFNWRQDWIIDGSRLRKDAGFKLPFKAGAAVEMTVAYHQSIPISRATADELASYRDEDRTVQEFL